MRRFLVFILIPLILNIVYSENSVYTTEWTYLTKGEIRNLSLMGNVIIFSSGEYEGFHDQYTENKIYAFDLHGKKLWEKECPYLIKKIQIEKNIYFSSGRYFYCYDPYFSELWHYSTNSDVKDFYVYDNEIFLFLEDGTIKFLTTDGEEKWERKVDSGIFLVFKLEDVYAGYYLQPYVYFLDSKGDTVWKYKTVENFEKIYVEDLDEDGEPEILTSYYKFLYATNKDGLIEWRFKADEYINDIYISDKIYAVAGKKLYILDERGNLEEEEEFEDQIKLVAVDDINNDSKKEILLGISKWDKNKQEWVDNYLYIGKKVLNTKGVIRNIVCIDSDNDGDKEVIIGADDIFFLKNNILEIKDSLNKKYDEYLTLYEKKDFDNAKREFLELKDEYKSFGFDTSKIDEVLTKIDKYENGYRLYNAGEKAFSEGNYNSAKINYQNARKYFEELGETNIVKDIDNKIKVCEENLKKETETPKPTPSIKEYIKGKFFILWIVIVVLLIVLIFAVKRRKRR